MQIFQITNLSIVTGGSIANEIISQAYEDLKSTQMELHETKKIIALTKTFQKFIPEQFLNRV
ncbi:uncharacterized protein METZ01_LOCUS272034, partial [marine metagenome]